MKKLFLAAALMVATISPVMAEDDFTTETGDFAIALEFNPFSDNFNTFRMGDNFKVPALRGRYFFNDNTAFRIGLGLDMDNNKTTPNEENEDVWDKGSVGSFAISIGLEKHFMQKGRLDLYYGADLGYVHKWACKTEQRMYNDKVFETKYHNEYGSDRAENVVGLNIITGLNFNVYKGLYVGTELGIGFNYSNKPATYTQGGYDDNNNWSTSVESDKINKANGFNLGTFVKPALRIGWKF